MSMKATRRQPRAPRAMTPAEVERIVHKILDESGMKKGYLDLEKVAAQSAKNAVHEAFLIMGIDTSNPVAVQEQFHTFKGFLRVFADEEFQQDLQHIRSMRRSVNVVKGRGLTAIVSAVVTGVLILFGLGFKSWVGGVD